MNTGVEFIKPESIALARIKAQAVLEQARTDGQFHQRVATNPAAILSAFGFGSSGEAASVAGMGSDPFDIEADCCNDYTCLRSECPSSCFVSVCIGTWVTIGCTANLSKEVEVQPVLSKG